MERRIDVIGQLKASVRDMDMAATLSEERRKALERHAVARFWNAIGNAHGPLEKTVGAVTPPPGRGTLNGGVRG